MAVRRTSSRVFQTSLDFDAEQSLWCFPRTGWQTLPPVDADLERLLLQQVRELEALMGSRSRIRFVAPCGPDC